MASLAKLTSLSTQTLSLLLERQRLQNLNSTSLHTPQIAKNLEQLRAGILAMEEREGPSEASRLLRSQHERMRGMLGPEADAAGAQRCEELQPPASSADASTSSTPEPGSPAAPTPPTARPTSSADSGYAPYTDDPEAGYTSQDMLLQQREIMEDQDVHLDNLSRSITRQRDISLQINDELDVHTGLLEGLDHDLDRTDSRLTSARRRLDRVAKGVKGNGSTVMIGVLILVLLILIIVFKT
ncbi:uncharacterized protein TRAVEDRAFT_171625 [Trametes versicolor FP-101664 SS1]|uniref:uncharacterized protein n=1 Tax=Trametes versicolor (strain FP-101664) TaxID=717944 RepID=UPI0004622D8D|nr:uncharacterized protein TRAVEDRAFT_171625 [Trametes versicolor FP-101664 SS1]EIW55752.1 hypothetical protein TRAVEDRAFT_171625 [Trametes versicolor FP-101664 SS1]